MVARAMGEGGTFIKCHAGNGNKREHIGGPETRMDPGVLSHVDELRRQADGV